MDMEAAAVFNVTFRRDKRNFRSDTSKRYHGTPTYETLERDACASLGMPAGHHPKLFTMKLGVTTFERLTPGRVFEALFLAKSLITRSKDHPADLLVTIIAKEWYDDPYTITSVAIGYLFMGCMSARTPAAFFVASLIGLWYMWRYKPNVLDVCVREIRNAVITAGGHVDTDRIEGRKIHIDEGRALPNVTRGIKAMPYLPVKEPETRGRVYLLHRGEFITSRTHKALIDELDQGTDNIRNVIDALWKSRQG